MPNGKKERKKLECIFILFTWAEIQTIGSGNHRKIHRKYAELVAEGLVLGHMTGKMTLEKYRNIGSMANFITFFTTNESEIFKTST
jgi:hypothetical protein